MQMTMYENLHNSHRNESNKKYTGISSNKINKTSEVKLSIREMHTKCNLFQCDIARFIEIADANRAERSKPTSAS